GRSTRRASTAMCNGWPNASRPNWAKKRDNSSRGVSETGMRCPRRGRPSRWDWTAALSTPKARKSRGAGWFEVIAGKSVPEEGAAKCFAYVQSYDPKPKRRLFELMKSQGLQANQQVTFLSDGAEDVRELPLYLSPESEYWLDWFHVTMRLTGM